MTKPAHPRAVAVSLIAHLPTTPSPSSSTSTPVSLGEPSFLLVSSRKHKDKWVQPKGGIERGESAQVAAQREAWEEAGLPIANSSHLAHLSLVPSTKPHPQSPSQDRSDPSYLPHSTYSFELFTVASQDVLSEHWPEEDERERKWVHGWDALKAAVAWGERGELMVAAADLAREKLSHP